MEVARFRSKGCECEATYPKSSACLSWFEKLRYRVLGPWGYSSGCNLFFTRVSFRGRYGPPYVRSLRNIWANRYRRTPFYTLLEVYTIEQNKSPIVLPANSS